MPEKNLNFVFWGTPDVASKTLDILKENGYIPSLIITSPDKPQGRKMIVTPPPVKVWAMENNIPYIQPEKLHKGENVVFKSIAQADEPSIANFQQKIMCDFKNNILPELFIVVAYGKIIPEEILNIPKFGSINVHYSLLPKYRGASPVESAILNGDTETGVTIQKMVYKMDAGDIVAQENTKIIPDETAPELRERLIKIGGDLLVKTLETPTPPLPSPKEREKFEGVRQDESLATHCKKIKKEDGLISEKDLRESVLDQSKSVMLYNKFRAYAHWPRTFFFKENKRIIITQAELENNSTNKAQGKQFVIKKVLPEGKKEIDWKTFQIQGKALY